MNVRPVKETDVEVIMRNLGRR